MVDESLLAGVGMSLAYFLYKRYLTPIKPAWTGSRRRLRAAADIGYAASISGSSESGGMAGDVGGGETAYPVRKALGFTAEQ